MTMVATRVVLWLSLLSQIWLSAVSEGDGDCYSAIFSFGDSLADTGSQQAAFPFSTYPEFPPYGMTYFGKPANRNSDGRLVIDFLGEYCWLAGLLAACLVLHAGRPAFTFKLDVVSLSSVLTFCGAVAAQGLNLPFLSPYLEGIMSNFHHGANFAAQGAIACADKRYTGTPFVLDVQVNQFKSFRSKVFEAAQFPGNRPLLVQSSA